MKVILHGNTLIIIFLIWCLNVVCSEQDILLSEIINGNPSDRFQSTFDYHAYKNWKHFTMIDKIYYLLEYQDLVLFHREYQYVMNRGVLPMINEEKNNNNNNIQNNINNNNNNNNNNHIQTDASLITFEMFSKHLDEFQSSTRIRQFWSECDTNLDGFITFTEYVICRGWYDAFGNPSDVNEYDLRANGVIADFENLVKSGKRIPGLYNYDENGIIIDN